MGKTISASAVKRFEVARDQLQSFYDEFVKLSNKKPDGAVNKFKLMHLNRVVKNVNELLGTEYVPFTEFTEFNEDEVPSNSDVVMMLSQYLSQMDRFHVDHSRKENQYSSERTWSTEMDSNQDLLGDDEDVEESDEDEEWEDEEDELEEDEED